MEPRVRVPGCEAPVDRGVGDEPLRKRRAGRRSRGSQPGFGRGAASGPRGDGTRSRAGDALERGADRASRLHQRTARRRSRRSRTGSGELGSSRLDRRRPWRPVGRGEPGGDQPHPRSNGAGCGRRQRKRQARLRGALPSDLRSFLGAGRRPVPVCRCRRTRRRGAGPRLGAGLASQRRRGRDHRDRGCGDAPMGCHARRRPGCPDLRCGADRRPGRRGGSEPRPRRPGEADRDRARPRSRAGPPPAERRARRLGRSPAPRHLPAALRLHPDLRHLRRHPARPRRRWDDAGGVQRATDASAGLRRAVRVARRRLRRESGLDAPARGPPPRGPPPSPPAATRSSSRCPCAICRSRWSSAGPCTPFTAS